MFPNHGMKYALPEGFEETDNGVAAPLLTLTRFQATMVAEGRQEPRGLHRTIEAWTRATDTLASRFNDKRPSVATGRRAFSFDRGGRDISILDL